MFGIEDPGLYRNYDRGEGQRVQNILRKPCLLRNAIQLPWYLELRIQDCTVIKIGEKGSAFRTSVRPTWLRI